MRIARARIPGSCETNRKVGVRSVVRRGPTMRGLLGRAAPATADAETEAITATHATRQAFVPRDPIPHPQGGRRLPERYIVVPARSCALSSARMVVWPPTR